MKRTMLIIILILVFLSSIFLPIMARSYALSDPITISELSSLAYALGSSFGFSYDMSGISSLGANEYFQNEINSWLNGRTIIEAFGQETARLAAGKLILPAALYNGLKDFLQQFKDDNSLVPENKNMIVQTGDFRYSSAGIQNISETLAWAIYNVYNISSGQDQTVHGGSWEISRQLTNDGIIIENGAVRGLYSYNYAGSRRQSYTNLGTAGSGLISIGASFDGEIPQTVLNPDKAWSGSLDGEDWPDTNLDQLLGHIDDMVIDGTLDVDGEIVDPPVPPGPIPTWVPVDDVIDGINQMGEQLDGLGNDIGDISGHLDDIGDQVDSIGQSLDGVQEGIDTQTGVLSGAIEQAAQDVVDAIEEQTATLDQTLTDTLENVQDIAEALEPGQITPRQFDLRRLFPFCIPFDIHNLLQKFDAEPIAPHVQLPFVIQSLGFSYMIDLDFSAFNSVASALRTVEFIVFAIGLAWATSKVIKW